MSFPPCTCARCQAPLPNPEPIGVVEAEGRRAAWEGRRRAWRKKTGLFTREMIAAGEDSF